MDRLLLKNYKCWLEQLRVPIANKLKRPLIGMCFYKDGLLEVNIDRYECESYMFPSICECAWLFYVLIFEYRKLLKLNKETHTWVQIGFVPPSSTDKWFGCMNQILILYGNVEDLVMNYNRIISGMLFLSQWRLSKEKLILVFCAFRTHARGACSLFGSNKHL